MKKVRKILAMVLAVSMLFGMQVFAADTAEVRSEKPIHVTLTPNFVRDDVYAGDELEFTMTATNVSEDTLGGFYWVIYSQLQDQDCRFGNPQIQEEDIPEIVQYNNGADNLGVASVLFKNDSFAPGASVSLTVTMEVTEEMAGDSLLFTTEAKEDQGDILSNLDGCVTAVQEDEVFWELDMEASLVDADLNKIKTGEELTFKVKVTNPYEEAVQNVYVGAGCSTMNWEDIFGSIEEGDVDFEGLVDFVDITGPDGTEMTEDGLYIAEIAAGATVELTVKGILPETFANGSMYFLFGAFATEEKDSESKWVGAGFAELEGTVVAKETVKPTPDPKPVNPPKKPADTTNKKTAPKTGDTTDVLLLMAIMLMAGGIVVNKKRCAI